MLTRTAALFDLESQSLGDYTTELPALVPITIDPFTGDLGTPLDHALVHILCARLSGGKSAKELIW